MKTTLGTLLFMSAEIALSQAAANAPAVTEIDLAMSSNVIVRAWQSGPIAFIVFLSLIALSVATWALAAFKFFHLKKTQKISESFIKSFWESRSLNDLSARVQEFPYSPSRDVFRTGYSELVRASQMKEQSHNTELAIRAALETLGRALIKAKAIEKRKAEKYLAFLAICASLAPFIGLFGTVWGIINAFEGIVRSGNTNLTSVAPGIAEALTSTALGLAAAIPAALGYNLCTGRIRELSATLDNFCLDFMNIVERYLVSDKAGSKGHSMNAQL